MSHKENGEPRTQVTRLADEGPGACGQMPIAHELAAVPEALIVMSVATTCRPKPTTNQGCRHRTLRPSGVDQKLTCGVPQRWQAPASRRRCAGATS